MSDSLVERLKAPLRISGTKKARADCEKLHKEAADRIEELEAVLRKRTLALLDIREATVETDWYWERADLALGGLTWDALKATEAETPEHPSTTVRTPLPSNEATSDLVLQDDFQEHKQQVERSLKTLKAEMDIVAQQSDNMRDRLLALEARIQSTSPNVSYRYSDWSEEGSDPIPASHGLEDITPEPTIGDLNQRGLVYRPMGPNRPIPDWRKDRRSGKERRVLKSVQIGEPVYFRGANGLCRCRRKSARRLQDWLE